MASAADRRFMAAAIRLSRKHLGLTGTNPSVATVIVRDGIIVGRGVTAVGGRPHAETEALAEAGERARGATAYVTLEPCAHHGRTPPCAEALVTAGVARVVGAASDPDPRVSGRGYAILRAGGVEVEEAVLADEAADMLAGYLTRSVMKRPEVVLKLAVSADGMIGRQGAGQVAISGRESKAQAHLMRSEADAILIGIGTAIADDPELTCRLPGLFARSPARIVLDPSLRLPASSKLVATAKTVPLLIAAAVDADAERRRVLSAAGADFIAIEDHDGKVALPELLDDLGAKGFASVLVEGGAAVAQAFLDENLVDRLAVFSAPLMVGPGGIRSPVDTGNLPPAFMLRNEAKFGNDLYREWTRKR